MPLYTVHILHTSSLHICISEFKCDIFSFLLFICECAKAKLESGVSALAHVKLDS